jgi:transcriptional regulator
VPHRLNLLLGTVDLLILRTLAWAPMHGYGITRWLRARSQDTLDLQDAALYKALRRLEESGAVKAEWRFTEEGRRARYYRLTPAGRRRLQRESANFRRYAQVIFDVLAPQPGEKSS